MEFVDGWCPRPLDPLDVMPDNVRHSLTFVVLLFPGCLEAWATVLVVLSLHLSLNHKRTGRGIFGD